MKKLFTLLLVLLCIQFSAMAQINLTSNGFIYSEDFTSLASSGTSSTLPTGFFLSETGTSANVNTTYTAGTGSSNSGETFSLGVVGTNAGTDRALGSLRSSTFASKFGAQIKNNSTANDVLTSVSLSYDGECWRIGTTSASRTVGDKLTFEYSTDATSLTTGTWTTVAALGYVGPAPTTAAAAAKDGNAPAFRTAGISATIAGLNIPFGNSLWIRWTDEDATSSDDVLAIDNFQITTSVLPVRMVTFIADKNILSFTTASEKNNSHFVVERSKDGSNFQAIGQVKGNGYSNEVHNYTFEDKKQMSGQNYYRLKQVDFDGRFEYSKIVSSYVGNKVFEATVVSAQSDLLRLNVFSQISDEASISVYDMNGRMITTQNVTLVENDNEISLSSNLQSGVYVIKIATSNGEQISKMLNIR